MQVLESEKKLLEGRLTALQLAEKNMTGRSLPLNFQAAQNTP